MGLINEILLDIMCLLFPLSVYLIFLAYYRNKDKNIKEILLEIALYSSIYLLLKVSDGNILIYPMILLNIPLLIGYLKSNNRVVIVSSIILIIYYYFNTNIPIYYLILEYLSYYIICKYILKKSYSNNLVITVFVFIKSFIMSLEMFLVFDPIDIVNNLLTIIIIMSIFTLTSYLILFLLNKGEEIVDLNNVVHELEKEKKLRESLFKITHEIKNPIAVCKGYLDMIDYKDIKKCKNYISIIKDEINRTLILMDDFLDYTKVKIEKEIVDINYLLEETQDIMLPLFKNNNIKFNLNIGDDELYMDLDYSRLKQVFVNILKNSIEAKDINKKDNYIRIDTEIDNDNFIIKIKDNGIGMDKDTLNNVDKMFYTTKEKGTGLGVNLSKEIINKHGGKILYESEKGKYTIVTISLPLNKKTT